MGAVDASLIAHSECFLSFSYDWIGGWGEQREHPGVEQTLREALLGCGPCDASPLCTPILGSGSGCS